MTRLRELASAVLRDTAPPSGLHEVSVELLSEHRLLPWLYRQGDRRFRSVYAACAIQHDQRLLGLAEVAALFAVAGVSVVVWKGMAVAGTLYMDPGVRPMSDIDLWAPDEASFRAATEVLFSAGFSDHTKKAWSGFRHARDLRRGRLGIDLHRSPLQRGRGCLDALDIWSRTSAGLHPAILRLDPVDELLFTLLHIGRHELWVPIMCYADAHRALERLTPNQILTLKDRARRYRVVALTEAALAATAAMAAGQSHIEWGTRWGRDMWWGAVWARAMPTVDELLSRRPWPRHTHLARKALLNDSPAGAMRFLTSYAAGRVSAACTSFPQSGGAIH